MFKLNSLAGLLFIVLLLIGIGVVLTGLSPATATMVTLTISAVSVFVYGLILDKIKSDLLEKSDELDLNELDYRLRLILKTLSLKVYVVETNTFYIAVIPPSPLRRRQVIFVSKFAKKLFSNGALDGAIAHEVGHVVKRHHVKTTMLLSLAIVVQSVSSSLIARMLPQDIALVASAFIALFITLVLMSVKRGFEFEADRVALKLVGEEKLMRSLKTISTFVGEEKSSVFDTHPPIKERIKNVKLASLFL